MAELTAFKAMSDAELVRAADELLAVYTEHHADADDEAIVANVREWRVNLSAALAVIDGDHDPGNREWWQKRHAFARELLGEYLCLLGVLVEHDSG